MEKTSYFNSLRGGTGGVGRRRRDEPSAPVAIADQINFGANRYGEMGDDFQLAPNPKRTCRCRSAFGSEASIMKTMSVEGGYQVTPI
jgi:hypothetical protein